MSAPKIFPFQQEYSDTKYPTLHPVHTLLPSFFVSIQKFMSNISYVRFSYKFQHQRFPEQHDRSSRVQTL